MVAAEPAHSTSASGDVTSAGSTSAEVVLTCRIPSRDELLVVLREHCMAISITLDVNGVARTIALDDPRVTLLDLLREHLDLTGTKKGCDHGQCGACTVHINGRRINSCLTFAAMHQGEEITTIEGIGQPDNLHPVQAAFVKHDGYQCGYCTSGQIMSAVALLVEPCGPTDADVQELMSGNICRCGAYRNIIAAIREVRQAAKLGGTNASL